MSPRHLAIIPDGNRRWARREGLPDADGHREGMQRMSAVLEHAWHRGWSHLSFWWGSPANLQQRDAAEVAIIVDCLSSWLEGPAPELLRRHNASFHIAGRWEEMCPSLRPGVERCRQLAGDADRALMVLMGYDGRDEIRTAAAALKGAGESEAAFEAALWTAALPPVDLILRTGGEPHLSAGFLLWNIAQAQLAFLDCLWPEITSDDLDASFERYQSTQRRYGR